MKINLLQEIQASAIDSSVSLADLLRKCAILAARLGNSEFRSWVNSELNGYEDEDKLPTYRILGINAAGHFSGSFNNGLRNAVIPSGSLPAEYRHWASEAKITDSISSLSSLIKKSDGTLHLQWPANLIALMQQFPIYKGMVIIDAWQVLSVHQIAAILDTVRNRVLNFVLEIESEAPDAGEWPSNNLPISKDTVGHVFHTHITGNVQNVVAGSKDFTLQSIMYIKQGDLESLDKSLRDVGVEQSDIQDLKDAIASDGPRTKQEGLGERVNAWIGKMATKVSLGLLNLGKDVGVGVLADLILKYYGLG
ncbi:MAG: hypothetical protein SFU83_21950 [Meiothermus sp.]|nr:hypothetical protein [Meiothermus sp.]